MYRGVSFLALLVLSAHAGKESEEEDWTLSKQICIEESGIEPEDFVDYVKDSEPNRKLKCFSGCMAKQRRTLNNDGTLNAEKAIENLPLDLPDRQKIVEAYRVCAQIRHEDECEMAHQVITCLAEKNVLKFLLRRKFRPIDEKHRVQWNLLGRCERDFGVKPEEFQHHPNLTEPSHEMKCFGACVSIEQGTLTEEGTLKAEKAIENLPADLPDRKRVVAAITVCAEKRVKDVCETAYLVFECLRKNEVVRHFYRRLETKH